MNYLNKNNEKNLPEKRQPGTIVKKYITMDYFLKSKYLTMGDRLIPIAIALEAEDGRNYFSLCDSFDPEKIGDREPYNFTIYPDIYDFLTQEDGNEHLEDIDYNYSDFIQAWCDSSLIDTLPKIADHLLQVTGWRSTGFCGYDSYNGCPIRNQNPAHLFPQFWSYQGSYDWVIFNYILSHSSEGFTYEREYLHELKQVIQNQRSISSQLLSPPADEFIDIQVKWMSKTVAETLVMPTCRPSLANKVMDFFS